MKSAYARLANQKNEVHDGVFCSLWQARAMPKALITAWRILLGRIPTSVNLLRRGVAVNSSICVLCRESEETSQHLFWECSFAQRVWSLCFRWIGVLFVQHKDLRCNFENFYLVHMSIKQNQVWKGMWVAIVRCIWEKRNSVIFKQGVPDAEEIFQMAQLHTWFWLKHRMCSFSYAFSNWHLNPSQCLQSVLLKGRSLVMLESKPRSF